MKPVATMLAAAVLAVACSSGPASSSDEARASDIRALRWVAEGTDEVKALTTRPASCMRLRSFDEDVLIVGAGVVTMDADLIETGRLAFESPALLGGAAARMGLSCSSCHINGRGNTDFFIEGMSDKPGTADVTSSLMSKVRGDGNFNPVPIPDLAARDGKQIRDRKSDEFRKKVHGLVVEEFDGQEPPHHVFEAVLRYLDRLDMAGGCNASFRTEVNASGDLLDALAALDRGDTYRQMGDVASAILMARVSRAQLERLFERFIEPGQEEVRSALVSGSRAIETWVTALRVGGAAAAPRAELLALRALIGKHQGRSLYNPDILRAALAEE